MPTELLLMPVGAGKTAFALDALLDTLHPQPFARVWALLPNARQEDAFRQRLVEHPDARQVYFNVEFFSFYTLYAHLLQMAAQPQKEIDTTARYRLLRHILARLQREDRLRVYSGIAHTQGFIEIVADLIYELKQNLIRPDDFAAAAQTDKDRDLALIYSHYQETLQTHKLVDREGEGWLALVALDANPKLAADVALLLVDGYDQFNPLQARLLAQLSTRIPRTLVTLPTVPGRQETVGRRFARALERIQAAHDEQNAPLNVQNIQPGYTQDRHPAINDLLERAFRPDAPARPSDGCLTLIEAPDPAAEVGALLRRVKRLLLVEGCPPDDIMIAVRDWTLYGRHLAEQARTYDLPVALHYGESLADNPAIIALINLLELHAYDFRRRDLIDVLRSPYFRIHGLRSDQVDTLERISQAHRVTGGRQMWLEAVDAAAVLPAGDGENEPPMLEADAANTLSAALKALFDAITPPQQATIGEFIVWLEHLIGPDTAADPDDNAPDAPPDGTFHMLACVRSGSPDLVSRDLTALHELKHILRSLLKAQFLAQALENTQRQEWATFYNDLKIAIGKAAVNRSPNRTGRVLVTTIENARGLPHRHLLIPGLSESIFPAPTPEDPLYLDSERRAWTQAGIHLQTGAERTGDEGLFYELIGLARQTLTLSRPTVKDGAPWPESHLWRAVKTVFDDADAIIFQNRIGLGAVVPATEAASTAEAALAVADGLNTAQPDAEVIELYNWLAARHNSHWARIRAGRAIELSRMSRQPHDRYSGRLRASRLIEWVADELGSRRVWSASQFNDFGMCGFRFFAKRLLKLEALEEPEEGLDVLQIGLVNHDILEKTYKRLRHITISLEHAELAVQTLREVAAEALREAPARFGFRASALWEQEKAVLLRRLEALVRLDFSDDSPIAQKFGSDLPRRPYALEKPFAPEGSDAITLTIGGEELRVRGFIDRIDRIGDRAVIVDYKSNSGSIPVREMAHGRNFQMMLYLLAAAHMLQADPDPDRPLAVVGGLFWHINSRTASGAVERERAEDEAAIRSAEEHLRRYLRRARAGNFAVHPNKPGAACAHYCDYSQFCRVAVTNRAKREAAP
ncbi:MAG: PD-(D/E)XK nuclease family protein [Chloroflexi bacterium]|nr:PD-(D/E)XK nuclease family protein [Chloroflexota bacterium]